MNFRRVLTKKLLIVATLMAMAALAIALVAVPVGAINQAPAPSNIGEVLNSPIPVPSMINYQGYLTDPDGNPINGTLSMTFSIYEVALEGTPVWTETHPSVTVTDGLFNVLLGSLNPINPSHLTGESYLGVQVGDNPEMVPRQPMVSVAYALVADNLDGMDSGDFVAVAGDTMTGQLILPANGLVAGTDQLVLTDGKVGIGTADPKTYKLYVQGGSDHGIYAVGSIYGVMSICTDGDGVSGIGSNAGVCGYHIGNNNEGHLGDDDGGAYGQHGFSGNYGRLGTIDEGVYGYNNGTGSYGWLAGNWEGVYGFSSTGSGVYGTSIDGRGVYGTSNTSTGVYGLNSDSGNGGLLGTPTEGVLGQSYSDTGVYGLTYDGYGVWGSSVENVGVHGLSSVKIGVYGRQFASGNYGYLGTSDEGVYGEYKSNGNFGQLGTSDEGASGYHVSSGNYGRLGTENDGVTGRSTVSGGSGVYGNNTSTGYGVFGRNISSSNYGYLGSSDYGVYGEHDSSGNYGRLGTSDEGVYGREVTTGNYGRLGTNSEGVYGYGNNFGVSGYSESNRGVMGGSQDGIGMYGYCNEGVAIYGYGDTWDFYAAHDSYGPFTGGHEVKLADSFSQDFRLGLIVSVTGETQLRNDEGEISYSSTLPTVKLADTPNDKKVFGVLISESPLPEDHWYQSSEGERFGIVNALGEGRVWVTNVNGDIEAGDYVTTSAIAGYGQKQDDDILHSYTLGKATETIDWNNVTDTVGYDGQTYKTYPIAIVYTSG